MDKDQGELLVDANEWVKEVLEKLSCPDVRELTISKCKVPNKEQLATWLVDALQFVKEQNDAYRALKNGAVTLKSEIIRSQEKVIGPQEELLASKTDQLVDLQTTVKKSVENTVKAEFVSYSAVVQKNQQLIWLF